jgi:alkanesulfonate monooxygenase SsuD/methylene tetrahydromethanopterin reductase-like flavin-dependent oxidoreductase (luciferase family)
MNESAVAPGGVEARPYGRRSVSLGLYLHPTLPAGQIVQELLHHARLGEQAGFDGLSIPEHHGGGHTCPPHPAQFAGWMLHATERVWVAPIPTLVALRPLNLYIEELAWLNAAFPGRVAAGVGPGYAEQDFDIAGIDIKTRNSRFAKALPVIVQAFKGQAPKELADDPAVRDFAAHPLQVIATAGGPKTAARAAAAGAGVIIGSYTDVDASRALFDAYNAAGGIGPRVLPRRVWVGEPGRRLEALAEMYFKMGAERTNSVYISENVNFIASTNPAEIADELARYYFGTGATALSLRFFHPGVTPEQIREQIQIFGSQVLPLLRDRLLSAPTQRTTKVG